MDDTAGRRPAVPPDATAEAPGALGVIEAFVNTTSIDDPQQSERFRTPTDLTAWLRRYGLLLEREEVGTDDEVARAVRLREALRELLYANHDGVEPPLAALEIVDEEARRVPVTLRFSTDGAELAPAGDGLDAALAALLVIVLDAMHDGTWRRLKACQSSTCRWAMWDASRNRSGKWCDMAVCGNRIKVRNYRERHAEG